MFRDLPKYAETTSNSFWSSRTPAHWAVRPGLAVLQENRRKNTGLIETQVLSLSYGQVVVKPIEKQRGLVPDSYEGYQVLDPGDIVVRPTDLQNDQTSIRVGHVKDHGIITSAYIGLRPAGAWDGTYAYQYLTVIDSTKRIYGMGSGLRQQLGWADLKRMPCLVPPIEEQVAIVKYLAHANARIDKAIATKRRLISLLNEQGRVVVKTVLSENMSGRERLGFHIDLVAGFPFKSEDFRSGLGAGGTSLLRGVNVGVGETVWDDLVSVDADLAESVSSFRLNVGDLVLGMDRPVISSGVRVAQIDDQAAGSILVQRVARLRPKATLDSSYLLTVMRSVIFERYLEPIFTGVSVPHLSPKQIRDFPIPLPAVGKQREIVAQIELKTLKLSNAVLRIQEEIALLQEFRTRLVSDVVTGQVDVRAIAVTLPEPPESFDSTVLATDDDLEEALGEGEE